jgi:hypothetical protein
MNVLLRDINDVEVPKELSMFLVFLGSGLQVHHGLSGNVCNTYYYR